MVEMYARLGKVKRIDARRGVHEVFEDTKKAMLPEIFFLIGAKGSGKSQVAENLSARANMKTLNFEEFLRTNSLDP